MADNFSFEETPTRLTSYAGPSGLAGFLIKKLHVPNEQVANAILVVIAVIIFIISGFIFASALRGA